MVDISAHVLHSVCMKFVSYAPLPADSEEDLHPIYDANEPVNRFSLPLRRLICCAMGEMGFFNVDAMVVMS